MIQDIEYSKRIICKEFDIGNNNIYLLHFYDIQSILMQLHQ